MRIITKKRQEEIDRLNIRKIFFAINSMYEELAADETGMVKDRISEFWQKAESLYYADDVVLGIVEPRRLY